MNNTPIAPPPQTDPASLKGITDPQSGPELWKRAAAIYDEKNREEAKRQQKINEKNEKDFQELWAWLSSDEAQIAKDYIAKISPSYDIFIAAWGRSHNENRHVFGGSSVWNIVNYDAMKLRKFVEDYNERNSTSNVVRIIREQLDKAAAQTVSNDEASKSLNR